jgi:hypoxanthine phosphoribosyltransferase
MTGKGNRMPDKRAHATPAQQSGPQNFPFTLPDNEPVIVSQLFTRTQIKKRVEEIARNLSKDLRDKEARCVTLVSILTGGFLFTADLLRELNGQQSKAPLPVKLTFIKATKYRGLVPGDVELNTKLLDPDDVRGKHVVLVDDVVESGETLRKAHDKLVGVGAATVTPVVLLVKQGKQRPDYKIEIVLDRRIVLRRDDALADSEERGYVGFDGVKDGYVVGYGMDYAGTLRDLSWIGAVLSPPAKQSGFTGRRRKGT